MPRLPRRESPATPFAFSLLLHALVFAAIVMGFASSGPRTSSALALLRPPETMTFRLVEAAGAPAEKPDEPTDLVSEKATRAADRAPRDLREEAPFNRGLTSLPNPTPGEGGREETSASGRASPVSLTPAEAERQSRIAEPPPPEAEADDPGRFAPDPAETGEVPTASEEERLATTGPRPSPLGDRRLEVPRGDVPLSAPPTSGVGGTRGLPQVDNRLSRARFEGDFSLSTYAWDYAPYMSRLKRQIEDYTWTILPSAFWYGIAAWATQVRFVILPDGRLESIVISGHEGVLELRHVAPDAVTGAAEFEPLPPGFPEPKLTVTGNFYFNVFPPGQGPDGEAGRDP